MKLSRRSLIRIAGLAGAAVALGVGRPAAAGEPLTPRPRDAVLDLSSVVIVAPESDEWQAVAASLADRIAEVGMARPTVQTPNEQRFAQGWSGHAILIGHFGNNVELARLYGLRYAMVDSWFPGPGGHWVCTVVNPFGLGGNTLVIGVTDLAGARSAVEALRAAITGPSLPRQHAASLSAEVLAALSNGGKTDPAYLQQQRADVATRLAVLRPTVGVETDAVKLHQILARIKLMGEAFLLTADAGFGELTRSLVLGYSRFVIDHPEPAASQLDNVRNMWGEGDELISLWAMTETMEIFSDEERALVLNALRATFAVNAIENNLVGDKPPGPRWNHEAYPALSLVAGADYFWRHHQLAEAQDWMERGSRIFTENTSVISLDEGADYLMHLPVISMDFAMLTGQRQFLTRTVRPSADLNVLMIDNCGGMVGGGDVYPYGASGVYTWGHSQVMHAAAWLFPEPIYGLLMERARTGPFKDNINTDLRFPLHRYLVSDGAAPEARVTTAPPTVMAYPVEEGVYEFVTDQVPTTVPRESTFHKLAFRAGLGIDQPTMMLDGFAGGTHNHQDTNAIIGYTASQRILLTDRDYLESTPEHHSGLVVIRDGQQPVKAQFSAVEWVADVDGAALSRTTVPDWSGTDWTRTVFTAAGDFHVVLDELTFNEDGNYLVKNQWQTLGTGELTGQRYTCRQQGVAMIIDSLDDSILQLRDRYGHFLKYYKGTYKYPYAEAETVLSQVVAESKRRAGQSLSYVNVIATAAGDAPDLKSTRWNTRLWQVTSAGHDWWFVTGAIDGSVLRTDATLSVFGPDRVTLAGATSVTIGRSTYDFTEPVIWHLDTANRTWAAYPVRRDLTQYDEDGQPIRPGPLRQGNLAWNAAQSARVIGAVRADEQPWRARERGLPKVNGIPAGWEQIASVSGTVTEVGRTAEANDPLLIGTATGTIAAVDADGATLWSHQLSGRVNEITRHSHDNDQIIAVATEAWRVHALGVDGTRRWERRFSNDIAHREQKGNLLGITAVRTGYINGRNQAPLLMVGTQSVGSTVSTGTGPSDTR